MVFCFAILQYLLRLVDQSGQGLHKDLPVTTGATGNIEKPLESGRVLRSPNLQVLLLTVSLKNRSYVQSLYIRILYLII